MDAGSEKISRAEKKSHLPGELHNRTGPVARVFSSRSALAKQQSSAVRGKKTKTGTGDGLGPWACDSTPEAVSQGQLTRCCGFRKMSYPSPLAVLVSSHLRSHTTPFVPEPGLGRHFCFLGNLRASFEVVNFRESCDPDATRSPVE